MKDEPERYIICWNGKRQDGRNVKGCGPFAHEEHQARYLASAMAAETGVEHFIYKEGE